LFLENDLGRNVHNILSVKNAFVSALNILRGFLKSEDELDDNYVRDFCTTPLLSFIIPVSPMDLISRNVALQNFVLVNPVPPVYAPPADVQNSHSS
jgi:hypothetical protein